LIFLRRVREVDGEKDFCLPHLTLLRKRGDVKEEVTLSKRYYSGVGADI